jgi:hypothetical protein
VGSAAAAVVVVAVAPAARPKLDGTDSSKDWDNTEIGALVALGVRPAGKFWADGLTDDGTSGDGATKYWIFACTWVKTGAIIAGTLKNGSQVDGTLKLHFHPYAKESANYLHIKRTDGADASAGQISKTHWLVKAIGLSAGDVTPDGTA